MKNWTNKYKKGGGYFPEYDSYAPPRMDVGGPGTGLTPGPVIVPIQDNTYVPHPFIGNIPISKPANTESTSAFDYQGYYDKANKYLSRPVFKGSSLSAKDIADAAQDFYKTNNYVYPLDLLLTQGQIETKLGKTLKSKNNFFNIGNTDSGATRNFASPKDSVFNYMNTMYNDYLQKGKKSPEDLLKPKGFVNYAGNRYASASDYETQLAKQRAFIQNQIKQSGGDISIPDLEQGNWLKKYGPGGSTTDGCPPYFTKNAFGVCVNASGQTPDQAAASKKIIADAATKTTSTTPTNNMVSSDATRVNRTNFNQTPQGKHHEAVINTMKTSPGLSYQQASDRVDMTNSSLANTSSVRALTAQEVKNLESKKAGEEFRSKYIPLVATEGEKIERMREESKERDEENAAINSAILAKDNNQPFTFPTGKTKTWDQMDWREKGYVQGLAQSKDLALFPGATSENYYKTAIDDLNPFPIVNRWVKGFAQSPYLARETDSYMPYVGAALDPAITVAAVMAGQPELSAGEALTANILNPKKPFQTLLKFSAAAEEGQVGSFMANKVRKDLIKDAGAGINTQLETNIASNNNLTANPILSQQKSQLLNTPKNKGINIAGIGSTPSLAFQAIPNFINTVSDKMKNKKYGGSAKRNINWTDKYK